MSGKSSGARRRAATAIAATAVSGLVLAVPLAGSASAATGTPAVNAGAPQDATVQADATSPLSITTTSLPDAMAGLYYGQQQLTAAGGAGPYTWEATGLPAGLTLSASGMLSGMLPATTVPGTYDFTVQAADAESPAQTVQQQLTLTVSPQPPLVITTTSLPAAAAGTDYSQQLTAAGLGSFIWSAAGLPAGMTLSASGLLSGATAAPGTYDITITLSGGLSAPQSVQQQLTLTVTVASLSVTTSSLPAATAGVGYSQQLAAAGGVGSYTWEATGLPAGLTLDASGLLSGTPTAPGTYDFTVQAADAENPAQTAQQQLTLTVNPDPSLVITTTSLPAYTQDQDTGYSQHLTATGGTGAYTWKLVSGTLPEGLVFSTSGLVSEGDPPQPAAGTYDLTVQAESGGQTVQQQLTLTVNPPLPLVITPSSLPAATAGTAYSQQLTVATAAGGDLSGDDFRWSITGLPAGMTLSAGWLLSGTPAAPGTYDVTITEIIPEEAPQSGQLTLTVNPAPPVITTTSLPAATAGTAYSQQLRTIGGLGPYTWTLASGTLPAGLTLSTSGLISGTPAGAGGGSSSISVQVTDSTGATAVAQLTLTGNPAPALSVTTSSLPAATAGIGYSQQLAVVGGVGSYTWEATGLPAGMTLDASGLLSGAPAAPGTYDFTVQAADAENPAQTAQQQLTLTVNPDPALVITTTSLPAYTQDTGYSQQLTATGGTGAYGWALVSGTLPAGVTLSPRGLLSATDPGTPAPGTYDFTVQAGSGGPGQTVQQQLTLTVNPALLVITPSSLPAATAGTAYSQQLTVAGVVGGGDPNRWSVTGLPAGMTLSAGWLLSGTPTAPGTYDVTITTAFVPQEAPQSGQLTLTVNPAPPVITTTSLPAATAGTAYSQQLRTIGGLGPYTWTLASGTLPAGLTLSTSGLISGTPAGAGGGSSSISVQVTDSTGATAVAQLTLTGNPAPSLSVTTTSLPAATAGTAYSPQQLTAAGGTGPYTWTLASGTLPAGLTLDASGLLGGAPAAPGTYDFTVQAADAENPAQTAQQQLTLTVNPDPALVITTTSLPAYTQDTGYSQQLTATGGTGAYAWTLASGTLPAGLTLSPRGLLSTGDPGTGTPAPGTYDFTVQAGSGSPGQTVQQQLTLTVNPALVITPSSLPAATAGTAYSQQLTIAGVVSAVDFPTRWSVTGLPAGMTLDPVDGVLSGTLPATTTPGTYDITITARTFPQEAAQSGQLTLMVNPAPLVITTMSLPAATAATAGTAYSQQLRTIGGLGPYTWTLASGTLPEGLTLSTSGLLSGTPTTPGTYSITVQAADGESPAQTAQQQLTLTVNAAPLVITTTSLPAATAGTAYSQQLAAAGGVAPYIWSVASGTLPEGLTLSTSGTISGTPASSGTSTFTVQAADGESPAQTVQQPLTLTVHAAPLAITTRTLPAATAGTAYRQQLTAAGGTAPYTWTLASGRLPAGITLSASGTISGTPTSSGTSTFTVQAADAENPAQTAQQQLTLTVHAAPVVITTRSLPNAAADHAYSQQLRAAGGAGPYSWSLASGRLPAGITLSREGALHGEPWAAGTYAFTVRATDSAWPAQSVTQRLSITVTGEKADLAVSVTGPSSARAGSRVTYTVTVKDNGPAWASMVSVSLDTAGLTDVKASDAGRVKLAESRDVAQASAAWYAAGLAPGQALTFTVTGTVPAKGLKDVSAVGQVQSPTSDPNPRNNTSTVTTKVR